MVKVEEGREKCRSEGGSAREYEDIEVRVVEVKEGRGKVDEGRGEVEERRGEVEEGRREIEQSRGEVEEAGGDVELGQ